MSFAATSQSLWTSFLWKVLSHRRDAGSVVPPLGVTGSSSSSNDSAITVARQSSRPEKASPSSSDSSSSSNDSSEGASKESTGNSLIVLILDAALNVAFSGVVALLIHRLIKHTSQYTEGGDIDKIKSSAVTRLEQILRKRGRDPKDLRLTSHETHIAEDIVDPDDIDSAFADIGGLDHLKQEIWELAVLPLMKPELFRGASKLVQQPSGILLYGRPGCGKTLLAKAIAKESDAVFIPIKLSKILNKWVGESNKLVSATFTLARKLAPSIIFIDELDTFLSDTVDPSSSKSLESLKAEFLTEWDGIHTNNQQVLVLGATNRPHLIDSAILRRMPNSFTVPLPDGDGREQILRVLLDDQPMDKSALQYLSELAHRETKGYSGSDLKALCAAAARVPIHEVSAEEARKRVMGGIHHGTEDGFDIDESQPALRPVRKSDFELALNKVKKTGYAARQYGRRLDSARYEEEEEEEEERAASASPLKKLFPGIDEEQLQQLLSEFIANMVAKSGSQEPDINGLPPAASLN